MTIHNWRVGAITENIFIVALKHQKRPIYGEIEVYKPSMEVNYYKIQLKVKSKTSHSNQNKMCRKNSFCPNCHGNMGKTVQARQQLANMLTDKPFVLAVVNNSNLKQVPDMYPGKKQLISAKYDVKLKTFALNEFLGRPVPNNYVNDLSVIQEEALKGQFTRLDKTLGFVDNDGKEVEMISLEQQQKMNDIMINILKAKGLDFDDIIAETARLIREELNRSSKKDRKDKKRKISKMKLKNQRKLGVVAKPVPTKSDPDAENQENGSNGKIKTAKDHEHYRKSKRPTRI